MTSNEIRQQFLDFFKEKEHAIVESSSVVPHDDPTLLFTNAGMNQFKDVFLGSGSRPFVRAADTQKCIRAGGKHNDLDDVGKDTYHHTFFEMLGNWSFGDYFKREAIAWAWELLTEVWGVPKSRLYATYFEGDAADGLEPDEEARQLWAEVTDIDPSHILPFDKKDNFWEMGDTGPCGPCSEIHIDLSPDQSCGHLINKDHPLAIEIWNLVFIQYNRATGGKLNLLPAKHVDTGMGFERLTAVLQGKTSNYDTDVFTPLFDAIRKRTGAPAYTGRLPESGARGGDAQTMVDTSYRVVADHLRTLTFALTDGADISNEGRGYVLRRVLRRAVRYGRQYFGMNEPFLYELVPALVAHMGDAFPELRSARNGQNEAHIQAVLKDEEESFGRTLDRGIKLFHDAAERSGDTKKIAGSDAFQLHDTYGFPIDLTQLMAEEANLEVDLDGYERLMEEAREKARQAGKGDGGFDLNIPDPMPATDDQPKFVGVPVESVVQGFVAEGRFYESGTIPKEGRIGLVLEQTSFYGEQGGQVGDRGWLCFFGDGSPGASGGSGMSNGSGTSNGGNGPGGDSKARHCCFRVEDTQRFGDTVIHIGQWEPGDCPAQVGDRVRAEVEHDVREAIRKNHTSTHLLNWALREVLGSDIHQRGSLLDEEKTRFDFSHNKPVSTDELAAIEEKVNAEIRKALPVFAKDVPEAEARKINTLRAVFGEKYPEVVRVVSVGAPVDDLLSDPDRNDWMNLSVEFCGGTHLNSSDQAGSFALLSEEGVAKGVRRVVAVTAALAEEAHENGRSLQSRMAQVSTDDPTAAKDILHEIQAAIQSGPVPVAVRQRLQAEMTALQKEMRKAEKAEAQASGGEVQEVVGRLLASAPEVGGVRVIIGEVPSAPVDALRAAVDWVRDKAGDAAVFLATTTEEGKVTLLAGMSKAAVAKGAKAGDLIKEVAPLVGGRGGGRPDMAQGGGTDSAGISAALERARAWVEEQIG